MKALLAIDPGNRSGLAWFSNGVLFRAEVGFIDSPPQCPFPSGFQAVVEKPQHHAGTKNPADIITLALTAGRWVQWAYNHGAADVVTVFPVQWKGSVTKAVNHARIIKRLSPNEQTIWHECRTDEHDAIGIGMKFLGRMGR